MSSASLCFVEIILSSVAELFTETHSDQGSPDFGRPLDAQIENLGLWSLRHMQFAMGAKKRHSGKVTPGS